MVATPLPTPPPTSSAPPGGSPAPDPSLAPFRPDPAKLDQLLQNLISPYASLHDVARNNDTTLAALTAWMAMPENQVLLDQVESAGYRRARMAGSNLLNDAVNSLSCSLRGHVEIETRHYAQLDYFKIRVYERARTNARKAAWLLYRISRSHPALPVDPATHLKLEEARLERARLKAQLRASGGATGGVQSGVSLDLGGTAGGVHSGVPSGSALGGTALQSGVSLHSCATTNLVQSGAPDQVPSVTPDPSPSPSLHHSDTDSLTLTYPLDEHITALAPHIASGATQDTHNTQDADYATLLTCGITSDTS